MVRNTLSEETKSAKIPNGNGSKGLTPGITLRFAAIQPDTKITCNSRNLGLPMNLTIASLWRSVRLLRSNASSSSLAIAAMLNCVGFAVWSDGDVFMQGTPDQPGLTFGHTLRRNTDLIFYFGFAALVCAGASVSAG